MLELWQAEWCPFSHAVRQKLTELELDWVARTVPVDRADRTRMLDKTGAVSIPTLVHDGVVKSGLVEILAYLAVLGRSDTPSARRHRAQMRAEWPHWLELRGTTNATDDAPGFE